MGQQTSILRDCIGIDAAHPGRRCTNAWSYQEGAGIKPIDFDSLTAVAAPKPGLGLAELIDIDEALTRLARLDERQARVVERRFFGRLEVPEVAAVLEVSEPTVIRDWRMARAWLHGALNPRRSAPAVVSDKQRLSDLYAKAAAIFERACEIPPEDRGAYLESAYGSDRDFLTYVDHLLASDAAAAGTFLEKPAAAVIGP